MISSGSSERSAAGKRLYWIGVLLALVVGVPFLNKPFHIDDTMVLAVSSQILREPLRPFHASINWSGDPVPIFEKTTNPPLVSYVLAPLVARFGYREAPLHLAMLGFLVILGLAMAWLARRFAGGSVWPVLFVMLSPGVAASVNVMRDVPMMALSAAAVAVFVAGIDRRRWPVALGGSALAGLAMLTKYSAVILFPVLIGYALLRRRGRDGLWLAAAAALLGLWCLQTQLTEGRIHLVYLLTTGRGGQPWTDRFYAALVTVGACLFLAPALLAEAASRGRLRLLGATAMVMGLALVGARRHLWWPPGPQYVLWNLAGTALLALTLLPILGALRRRGGASTAADADSVFLALWTGAAIVFAVLGVMFQAVRHVLPVLPPLALLAVRSLRPNEARIRDPSDRARRPMRWTVGVLGVCLLAQAVVAFGVGAADYAYADTYRQFAHAAKTNLPRPGRDVWFFGHWGWQLYASSAGFRQLAGHGPRPKAGDALIVPDRVDKEQLPAALDGRLARIQEKTYYSPIPLQTMGPGSLFYGVSGGNVPYIFTRERKLETFRVYRVEARRGARPPA
jgi:4-amino-4-deoxy-L-arabinose transferase-like glycosyltransferase